LIESMTGQALNLVSGVWLALAWDTKQGIFYRDLSDSGAYGGTRYFPLTFLLAGAYMRAGLGPVGAGQFTGLTSIVLLAGGVFRFLEALGSPRRYAALAAILALSAYFVQHTIFAVRSEPLAAAFVMWGATSVARRLGGSDERTWAASAAAAFALAMAAKPTAMYGGIAAVLALVSARRTSDALWLLVMCVVLWISVLLAMHLWSGGTALRSIRACALAGASITDVVAPRNLAASLLRLSSSRVLSVVLIASLIAVFVARAWTTLPSWLLGGALATSALTLSTAGTILTNQAVEPYVAASACLIWVLSRRPFAPTGALLLTGLLLWTSAQNVRELRRVLRTAPWTSVAQRTATTAATERCRDPWFAESPLLPVLSDRRPLLLDPFAFRVAAQNNPELAKDLIDRLVRREFWCVVLEHDPETDAGREWYRNVHLGEPVIEAVRSHYRFAQSIEGHRFYIPFNSRTAGP
jgi:hypothetical protein